MRVKRYWHTALLLVLLLLLYQMVPVCITKYNYFDEPAKTENFFLMPVSLSGPELALTTDGFRSGFRILPAGRHENKICQIDIIRLYDKVSLAILPVNDIRQLISEVMNQYFNGSKYKLIHQSI